MVTRREQLLDAADAVVQRAGADASMSAVATEAGITKPVLYRHFGNKGGLYRALAERYTEELLAELRVALVRRGGLRSRTRATIDTYLAAIEARPEVYRFLLHRAAVEDVSVRGQVTSFVRRLADELAAGLVIALDLPPSQRARADAWANGIVGMVQGAGDWWLDERSVSRSTLVELLTDLLAGGLARDGWSDVQR